MSDRESIERFHALENNECPECGSENGYWQHGEVADYDYVCEDCGGIFDQDTAERIGRKPLTDGGFVYPIQTAEVGEHYGAGKQSHVPTAILDHLEAEPGDRLVYRIRDDEVVLERGDP